MLLDEPTSSLTPWEVERLFVTLRGLADGGVGIVYISHRLDEIGRLCDRVTVIRDGANVEEFEHPADELDAIVAAMTPGIGGAGERSDRRHHARVAAGPGGAALRSASMDRRTSSCTRARSWASSASSGQVEAPWPAPHRFAEARLGEVIVRGSVATFGSPADAYAGGCRVSRRGPQGREHPAGHVGALQYRRPGTGRYGYAWRAAYRPHAGPRRAHHRTSVHQYRRRTAPDRAAERRQPAEGGGRPPAGRVARRARARRTYARDRRGCQARTARDSCWSWPRPASRSCSSAPSWPSCSRWPTASSCCATGA